MCDDDGDRAVFQTETWRTARIFHECYACREVITPGDRYHHTTGKWDGRFTVFKHCARCRKMCEALWEAGARWVDYSLDCGAIWTDVFGNMPASVEGLAFALPGDFQRSEA
jgi:hypothetical protein